jgi:hypothetical protein
MPGSKSLAPRTSRVLGPIPLGVLLALFTSNQAQAAAATPAAAAATTPAQEPPISELRWYGWQLLASDAATVGLLALSLQGESTPLAAMAFGTYTFAPVGVHLAHHHPGRALLSVGLRIALPIVLAKALVEGADCAGSNEYLCGVGEMYLGVAGGALAASLVDQILSFERYEIASPKHGLSLAPTLQPRRDGATLGLIGSF